MQKLFNIGVEHYRFDVLYYNSIGISMFENGKFSFQTMLTDFRGYLFPLYLGICHQIDILFHMENSIHIISSLILTLFFAIYLDFCQKIFKGSIQNSRLYWISVVVPIALVLIFFYGLIVYPLTDLYAALLCITAGWFVYSAMKETVLYKSGVMFFCAGLCMYGAYNIRTIYMLSIYCFLAVILLIERKNIKKLLLGLTLFVLGCCVCAIPQFIINFERYNIISPWINNRNLFGWQLFWGLQYSRYATYVGSEIANLAGMYFIDSTGKHIVDTFMATGGAISIENYIKLFFAYPLEFIAIIGKHFYNAIFLLFPEQYILTLDSNRYFYAIFSLIVVYIFCAAISTKPKKTMNDEKLIILAILLPSIAILFGAVEERFLVLPYMLVYGYLSNFDWQTVLERINKQKIIILLFLFIIFVTTALSVESEILSSLQNNPFSFSGLI